MHSESSQEFPLIGDAISTSCGADLKHAEEKEIKAERMSHLKKEKSRDAARCRRGKENVEFYKLAKLLPIPEETSTLLDKASIVRLTMSFLQLHKFFRTGSCFQASFQNSCPSNSETARRSRNNHLSLLSQCLDGFLIVINRNGRCLYVSDAVNSYLGIPQVDLMGANISNFVHPTDYSEFQEHLRKPSNEDLNRPLLQTLDDERRDSSSCSFFIRMKSTLARRGSNVKATGFKVVHLHGRVCHKISESQKDDDEGSSDEEDNSESCDPMLGFVGVVQILPPPLVDIRLDEPIFITRLDPSLRVLYCEEKIKDLASYDSEEVKGCTIYQFVHTADLDKIAKSHTEILNKGQAVTPYYRWLLKNGSYIWVQSSVALLQDKQQCTDEDEFVWITYIICHGRDKLPGAEAVLERALTNRLRPTSCSEKCLPPEATSSTSTKQPNAENSRDEEEARPFLGSVDSSNEPKPAILKYVVESLVKQSPEKPSKLKRVYSSDVVHDGAKTDLDDASMASMKRERRDRCFSETGTKAPFPAAGPSTDSGLGRSNAGDVLDVDSTMWGNPPNREVSNQSDLNTTVMHHHYPYGIDPSLLNSNPIFAKMLTTNYVTYEPLLTHRDAFLLAPPTFFTPMLNTLPHLVPAPPGKVTYCPPAVATIIDELRQDPMRKKNPPNKVVLSCARIPQTEEVDNNNRSSGGGPTPSTPSVSQDRHVSTIPPPLLSLSESGGLFIAPLGSYQTQGANNPIILQPFKLAHGVNAFNSLPI